MYDKLINSPIFIGLNSEEIEQLLQKVHFQLKSFNINELIVYSGDEVQSCIIILEGSVKGEMVDFAGKIIKIEDIESPRPLAPAFLFGMNNKYPVNIVANEKVKIISIPKYSFLKLLQLNEVILKNFLDNVSNRAQFLSNKIKFLSFHTIKGKVAHYILQFHKQLKSDIIVLQKSQNELSEMFGVTRPSLGRAMRELHNSGLIKASGKQIKIIDKEGLSALLHE